MLEFKKDVTEDDYLFWAVPFYDTNVFTFKRNEKNGNVSVRLKTLPRLQELFFNETSFKILNLCDGRKNCKELLMLFCESYPNIDRERLKNDFFKIITFMSKFQIISWKERNPLMSVLSIRIGRYNFELLDDTHIREILSFIKNNSGNLQWMNLMHDYKNYDELYIREMLFNYAEDFFGLREENGDLVGLASIKYSVNPKSSVSHVGLLISESTYVDDLIKGIVTVSGKRPLNSEISKIKIQILEIDLPKYKFFIDILRKNNFVVENVSIKEFKGKNLVNYCYYHQS